ncbi:hypothetical protein Ciccas_001176 [Cichlidogyrus casuarinus]|uniref:BESS domain-containing protein n=1 Tax=Cichlidogyrus casuarinus TaxID=1844966 RepID=A0ABD2QKR8_9PLAT
MRPCEYKPTLFNSLDNNSSQGSRQSSRLLRRRSINEDSNSCQKVDDDSQSTQQSQSNAWSSMLAANRQHLETGNSITVEESLEKEEIAKVLDDTTVSVPETQETDMPETAVEAETIQETPLDDFEIEAEKVASQSTPTKEKPAKIEFTDEPESPDTSTINITPPFLNISEKLMSNVLPSPDEKFLLKESIALTASPVFKGLASARAQKMLQLGLQQAESKRISTSLLNSSFSSVSDEKENLNLNKSSGILKGISSNRKSNRVSFAAENEIHILPTTPTKQITSSTPLVRAKPDVPVPEVNFVEPSSPPRKDQRLSLGSMRRKALSPQRRSGTPVPWMRKPQLNRQLSKELAQPILDVEDEQTVPETQDIEVDDPLTDFQNILDQLAKCIPKIKAENQGDCFVKAMKVIKPLF